LRKVLEQRVTGVFDDHVVAGVGQQFEEEGVSLTRRRGNDDALRGDWIGGVREMRGDRLPGRTKAERIGLVTRRSGASHGRRERVVGVLQRCPRRVALRQVENLGA